MERLRLLPVLKILSAIIVVLFILATPLRQTSADTQISGWLSNSDPTLQKLVDMPAGQIPNISNRDCTQLNYTNSSGTNSSDCFVQSPIGSMALFGSPVLFNNSSKGVDLVGYGNFLMQPVPNQSLVLSTSSASLIGTYINFYSDLRSVLVPHYNGVGGPLVNYSISSPPNIHLRDKNGSLLPTSSYRTLAYSSDGAWLMVDAPGRSFLRVNLATFEVTPFAPTLNAPGDYADHVALTAISNDGRFAAIASYDYKYFKVYDLSTCTGTILNDYSKPLSCQSHDYWPYIAGHINGLQTMYSIRFTNDDNIRLAATYKDHSNNTLAAQYSLTAPDKSSNGINYLALGDSYISGEGAFNYKTGTDTINNHCHLSLNSYPYQLGVWLNNYASIACSGAKSKDIIGGGMLDYNTNPKGAQSKGKGSLIFDAEIYSNFLPGYRRQLDFINMYGPRIVTVSIGGNDLGFSDILKACVLPYSGTGLAGSPNTCFNEYQDRVFLVNAINSLFGTLKTTYTKILEADPGVKLYVIGYPQVAAVGNCATNVHLNDKEILFSQQLINYFDSVIKQAADAAGAAYVDVQHALDGHRLCEAKSSSVAINGLTAGSDSGGLGFNFIGQESYHPNVLGHQLLANAIFKQTSNLTLTMSIADASLTVPAFDPSIPLLQVPQSPTQNYNVTKNEELTEQLLFKGSSAPLSLSGDKEGLKPNSSYQVVLHSSPINLSNVTTDSNGNLNTSIRIPDTVPTGFHTLHLYGQNMANQTVDLYEIIYVATNADDYDGDGVLNNGDQCIIVPLSSEDVDKDGIDDACDPLINDAPQITIPGGVNAPSSEKQEASKTFQQNDENVIQTATVTPQFNIGIVGSDLSGESGSSNLLVTLGATNQTVLGDSTHVSGEPMTDNKTPQGSNSSHTVLLGALSLFGLLFVIGLLRFSQRGH